MKEFDLKLAKQGVNVMTRSGSKARIICFDAKDPIKPIVALVTGDDGMESIVHYAPNGKCDASCPESDLVMDIQHHEGWIIVRSSDFHFIEDSQCNEFFCPRTLIYDTYYEAKFERDGIFGENSKARIVHIEWDS